MENYLMLDIETTGPVSALHSMIEFAVVHLEENGTDIHFDYFQSALKEFDGKPWRWESDTLDWWHHPDRVNHLRAIEFEVRDPYGAMLNFKEWMKKFKNPVIVCFGSDMEFLKLYWWRVFRKNPPFGLLALDAKSFAAAVLGCDFNDTTNTKLHKNFPELFHEDLPHTHRALDDAKEQAYAFFKLRRHRSQVLRSVQVGVSEQSYRIHERSEVG